MTLMKGEAVPAPAYWKARLAGLEELVLPVDRTRPAAPGGQAVDASFDVPPETIPVLERPFQDGPAALEVGCSAALAMLLARYADRDEVLLGVAEQAATGPVRLVPLRLDLSGDPTFATCAERVRSARDEALDHGILSLPDLEKALEIPDEPARPPLVQAVCGVHGEAPGTSPPVPDLAHHDLVVTFGRHAAGLSCHVIGNADLFTEARVADIAAHLQALLQGIAAPPPGSLWTLPLLPGDERRRVVLEWNEVEPLLGSDDAPIHEIFEARARQWPDRVAVTCGDRSLTYADLNRRANQVAHTLRRHCRDLYGSEVAPDELIGICVERDIEMVVGILAILKAGGAYVPLDPRYPEDRLRFMAQDACCRLILTQQSCLEQMLFFAQGDFGVISLDGGHAVIRQAPADNLPRTATTSSLAYVIYTSGSTGRPKGVLIEHGNVRRLMKGCEQHYDLSERDVWTCFHSYAFDFSVWEIWGALLYGGRLVVVPYSVSRDPEQFHALLCDERVTVLSQTPSAFYQLIQADLRAPRRIPALRYVTFGGEALELRRLIPWWSRYPADAPQLVNMYGITETTVHSTCVAISPADLDAGRTWSPIGRRLCDLSFYVLDRHRQPVPVGIPGELFIGGAGLARGYFQRPELDRERFVANPCLSEAERESDPGNARLYKTGDVVRWVPDGTLEYVGRNDFQVKIRGFRIELGEIEAHLERHPEVAQAVVAAVGAEGGPMLVAWYVPRGDRVLPAADLRAWLRTVVPDYMVPQAFVPMAAMPLGATGKTDRRALPAPSREHFAGEAAFVAPRTPAEEAVAAIFRDVLKAEKVGVQDDFFAAGGHSLMATQVVSRVRETFGVSLPLHALFEHRTVERLAAVVLEAQSSGPCPEETIHAAPRDGDLPLSFAQARLWFINRYEGSRGSHYNVPLAIRLRGALDVPALELAIGQVLARHEVLRTSYPQKDGVPYQRIAPWTPFRLPREVVVLEDLAAAADPEALLEAYLTMEANCPFDLEEEAPIRFLLFEMPGDEHVLMINGHHILTDGWSVGVLLRELGQLYAHFHAHAGGPDSQAQGCIPLPPLPLQYADFAAWQRKRMASGAYDDQVAYWRAKLEEPPQLDLPTDHARPAVRTYHGARVPVRIDADVTAALTELAQARESTLFMVLLAAFALQLSRYSGQDDIIIGTPIANRHRRELEPLLGFFVNTLPIRCDLGGRPKVWQVLERVRAACLEAYENQDVPFESMVEMLNLPRDPSRTPLVSVMLNFQNATDGEGEPNIHVFNDRVRLDMPGLRVDDAPFRYCQAQFDLTLTLDATSSGLVGSLEYATDLFDRESAQRMVGHWETALKGIAGNFGILPLLTDRERRTLVERNATDLPYRGDTTIHGLFQEQVERTPDAVAVRCEDRSLTYRQLHERADRVARLLALRGAEAGHPVEPDALVGLCLERHVDRISGILGVLASGAAYVPIDPTYPPERVAYILEDAGIRLVVTESALVEKFPVLAAGGRSVIRLDCDLDAEPHPRAEDPPLARLCPDHLAYVIYTSGSTGRPKGVAITHRNACQFAAYLAHDLGFGPGDRIGQFASICFDVSVLEWVAALTSGAELYVFSPREMPPHADVGEVIERRGLTFCCLAPGVLESMELRPLPTLHTLMSGGDVLPPQVMNRWAPGRRFINAYGPTEITVCCTNADCHPGLPVTIGRPLPNAQIWILDRLGHPVPDGVLGELYVGGKGLAQGYLGRPELTAERFVPAPAALVSTLGVAPGTRLYRTGDLGRWTLDGQVEYLGRLDLQVKIRGFRIEPGEIESELARHPAVRECAVVVHEHRGEKRLAACWVATPEASLADPQAEFESHLARALPAYMIPSDFVRMDHLPLTTNGKLDRQALTHAVAEACEGEGEGAVRGALVAPRTATEASLVEVFREVLELGVVSTSMGFFQLGGHSLNALRMAFRLEKQFGVAVDVRALFEHPRIDDLARHIDRLRETSAGVESIPRVDRRGALELSLAQERLWFLDRLEASQAATYNMPQAFRLKGDLDVAVLRQALQVLVQRHESLRMRFPEVDGRPQVEIVASLGLALDVEPWPAERLGEVLSEEALRPFDLARGPLVRARLFGLGPRLHVLLLVQHHIVSDGWSVNVLTRELSSVYTDLSHHRPVSLPPLAVDFADFAQWQRQRLSGPLLDQMLARWCGRLEGAVDLDLPCDRPRPPRQTFRGSHHFFRLDPELWEAVDRAARDMGVTPYTMVLAAFAILLERYSDQDDVTFGSPAAGRTHRDLQDMVGFFVNTLALRFDLAGNPSLGDFLAQVREVCQAAQADQEIPFHRLVQALGVKRDPSRSPLFQVVMVYQDRQSLAQLSLPGVRVDDVGFAFDVAKFDLAFNVGEKNGSLEGEIEFNVDLFDPERILRMAAHFETLLHGLVKGSLEDRVDSLPMLTPPEVEEASGTAVEATPPSSGQTVHGLFEAQAARRPGHDALAWDGGSCTYAGLDRRATSLARRLRATYARARGCEMPPETVVALCTSRGLDWMVAMLAALKAGAAHLPVDPTMPPERIRFILEDSDTPLVLAHADILGKVPLLGEDGRAVVVLDEEAGIDASPDTPLPAVHPDHLACVIYTSGSTGRPKGVLVEHRNLVNFIEDHVERLGITERSRVLQHMSTSFDASWSEIGTALAAGATLVLGPRPGDVTMEDFADFMARHGVTYAAFPAAVLEELPRRPGLHLEVVEVGGDVCRADVLDYWRSQARLVNSYGPTETAVTATSRFLDGRGVAANIGHPIRGVRALVLDTHSRLVPAGIPGELYIGGAGVTRGYLRRVDLTRERFVPDPTWRGDPEHCPRLYRTGDVVRRMPDGSLVFCGRRDFQVKIRGFRIELGEIEETLRSHDAVEACAAGVRTVNGDRRLVAWYEVKPGVSPPAQDALRAHLAARLIEAMVPSLFVRMEHLPLNAHGKLDRQALPDPDPAGASDEAPPGPVEPRTDEERQMLDLWREVLGRADIGLQSDFFSLGGHSLLATRLASRINATFDLNMPVNAVFTCPTVERLAERVKAERWALQVAGSATATRGADEFEEGEL